MKFTLETRRLALIGALASASFSSVPALAADSKTAGEAVGLPEVIVTAQKREEKAQSIGVALSVVDVARLAGDGVVNVNQLQYLTPALSVTPSFGGGQPNFRLRGVGFDDYASNNTSTVGVYVDDVAYALPIETQGLLFDVARVEVLRGPQGTLYGRNTTGGAVNILTGKPTDTASYGGSVEIASHDAVSAEGYVSGPLAQGLTGRLSAIAVEGGGWQHNRATGDSLGDADKTAVRAQLRFVPDANSDYLLSVHYGRDHSEPTGLYLFQPLTTGVPAIGVIPADASHSATGWGGSSLFQTAAGVAPGEKPFRRNESDGASLTANWSLSGARLTSITAFDGLQRREYNDWDASAAALAGTLFHSKVSTWSQELRLASTGTGRLKWVAGLFFSGETLKEAFISDFAQAFGFDALTTYKQTGATQSVFGQATWTLTDTLDIVGGLRVEHEERKLKNFATTTLPVIGIGTGGSSSLDYTEPTGKIALEYKPAPDTLYYASFSRGVKSGGFTAYNTLAADQLKPFQPEKLLAFEAGFKRDLFDRTLRVNGAAYYYDYADQQVQSAIYDSVYGAVGVIKNADAHIWGAELEGQWKPTSALYVTQSLGYSTGEFTSFQDLNIAASTAAGHAVYTSRNGQTEGYPHLSYGGSVVYDIPAGDYVVETAADYAFHDKVKPTLLGPLFTVAPYWLVNAEVTLKPVSGPWAVSVFARNLFNEKYDLTRNFFLGGIDIAAPGAPATYGIRLTYKH
jgi:outer membrane receptor protein involved in Fe transport